MIDSLAGGDALGANEARSTVGGVTFDKLQQHGLRSMKTCSLIDPFS